MQILSAKQIKERELFTMQEQQISSLELMERAALACFQWIVKNIGTQNSFNIFCGRGNNGGDGLAIARLLSGVCADVSVYILPSGKEGSSEFIHNKKRLAEMDSSVITLLAALDDVKNISENSIVIDAIFGTGLNHPAGGLQAEIINYINKSCAKVISIDVPSGMFADIASSASSPIIKADYTLTFEQPKLSFFFESYTEYCGNIEVLSIELSKNYLISVKPSYTLLEKNCIKQVIKKRKQFSHKGDYGHAAIIAGSYGKMGAAVLACKACLRTGAGLLTACIPEKGYNIMQISVPEAMVVCGDNEKYISGNFNTDKYDVIGIGPGIGTEAETATTLKILLQNFRKPLVLDADALNILAGNKTWLDFIPPESILTPHAGEFVRLAGRSADQAEQHGLHLKFSARYNVYVILKGKYTGIACPDGSFYFNPTGNPGMAKGGSGDALTGMITGFMAQHYTPLESCIAGVYLHGMAADIAAKTTSEHSLLATDVINSIGNAFQTLSES